MRRSFSESAAQMARSSPMNLSSTGIRGVTMVMLQDALFAQWLAFDGATAQQPALFLRKVGAGVDRAAVVPHQEIAELPDVFEDELAPLADLVKLIEDGVALGLVHAFDPRRHQPVDEQRLAAGVGVRDEQRMVVMRDAADVAR